MRVLPRRNPSTAPCRSAIRSANSTPWAFNPCTASVSVCSSNFSRTCSTSTLKLVCCTHSWAAPSNAFLQAGFSFPTRVFISNCMRPALLPDQQRRLRRDSRFHARDGIQMRKNKHTAINLTKLRKQRRPPYQRPHVWLLCQNVS